MFAISFLASADNLDCARRAPQRVQAVHSVSEQRLRVSDPLITMGSNAALPLQYVFRYLGLEERLRIGEVCKQWRETSFGLWGDLDLAAAPEDAPRWFQFAGSHADGLSKLRSVKVEFSHTLKDADLVHLRKFPKLQRLVLNGCQEITEQGVSQLLPEVPELIELQLYWNLNVSDNLLFSVAAFLENLQRLNISGCKAVSDDGIRILAASCQNITDLDLTRCIRLTDASIVAISEGCPSLRSLNLYACATFTDAALAALGSRCPALEMLDLCGALKVTDRGVKSLVDGCRRLRILNLTWCGGVSDSGVVAISRGCHGLELLSLHGNTRITDTAIDALSRHVKDSLTTLDISGAVQVAHGTSAELLEKLPSLRTFQVHS